MGKAKSLPQPRSLQEWMERTGTNGQRLIALVRRETGVEISPTLLSFYLRRSRRVAIAKAWALSRVTGIPEETLTAWPPVYEPTKLSGKRPKRAA